MEAIRRLERVVGSPWLFTGRGKGGRRTGLRPAWKTIKKAAGLESLAPELGEFRIHDLRHHRITVMLASGVAASLVKAQVGWKSLAMLRVYSHVDVDDAAAVLSRLEPVEPAPGGVVVPFVTARA
jgi:integrase